MIRLRFSHRIGVIWSSQQNFHVGPAWSLISLMSFPVILLLLMVLRVEAMHSAAMMFRWSVLVFRRIFLLFSNEPIIQSSKGSCYLTVKIEINICAKVWIFAKLLFICFLDGLQVGVRQCILSLFFESNHSFCHHLKNYSFDLPRR